MTDGLMAVPAQAAYTLADFQPVILKELYDRYDSVGEFQYGVAFVSVDTDNNGWDDRMGLIDKTGKELVAPIYDMRLGGVLSRFAENGLSRVSLDEDYGYINTVGKLAIPCKYSSAWDFSDGLASVRLNEKSGYIDSNGKTVIPFIYENAGIFSDGLAAESKEFRGSYGYINKQGKMVISAQYDEVEDFQGGYAVVWMELPEDRWNFRYGIIDIKSNVVVSLNEEDYGEIRAKQREIVVKAGKADYIVKNL